jgi:hypothetical protein
MKNYYEKGDCIQVSTDQFKVSKALMEYSYKDAKGRHLILQDITDNPTGTVKAVKEGTGHLEVLYQPDSHDHSWWLPTTIIKPLNNNKHDTD